MRSLLDLRRPSLLLPLLLLASCSGSSSASSDDPDGAGGRSGESTGGSSASGGDTNAPIDEEGTGGGAPDGLGGEAGAADTGGGSDADEPPQPEGGCRTTLAANGTAQIVEVCRPADGAPQHVRLENVDAGAGHTSVQLFLGFDEPPTSTQGPLAADQFKIMLYSGTPKDVHVSFGEASATLSGDHSFTGGPSTLCFDLGDGAVDRAPRFVLWVDGVNGATCSDFTTLTEDTAYGSEAHWGGALGIIAKAKGMYLYRAGAIDADPSVVSWSCSASSCVTRGLGDVPSEGAR